MLHVRTSRKAMGNDPECLWPVKKSRIQHDEAKWELLPAVILHEIYSMLSPKDRFNASSTCQTWRQNLYHPKFWRNATFKIYPDDLNRARYFRSNVGRIVTNAVIKVDTLTSSCMKEFIKLLRQLNLNDNLLSLVLEPNYSHMDLDLDDNMLIAQSIINICSRRPLHKFSLGMNEELLQHTAQYLQLLGSNKPDNVTTLGLATIKDDPNSSNYYIFSCDPALLTPFRNLKILSVDYDVISDTFLNTLNKAKKLERLAIHVHAIWDEHEGTTEEAWESFSKDHPNCEVRLSLIHAYNEVMRSDLPFLRRNMRLTHFRALFCENINIQLLDVLSRYYSHSLECIMWIDSINNTDITWNLIHRNDMYISPPDPLVILAWLCYELKEISIIGYKYSEDNLVAIARLRENSLNKLEVAEKDVIFSRAKNINARKEITDIMGKQWHPLRQHELHPVILDPSEGDSAEFISPYLSADLR